MMPDDGDTAPHHHEMDGSADVEGEPSVWEVRIGIYATRRQAWEVKERFTRLLCPEPEHPPPCPIPWSASGPVHESEFDDSNCYAELTEQGEGERELRQQQGL